MSETIFETIHGSHLYGLAHAGSDMDIARVTTSTAMKARHHNGEEFDTMTIPWDVFLGRIFEGSHQSVETMFSPYKVWTPGFENLKPFVDSYRVTGSAVFAKYERTITKFCYGDFKRRRHAIRLRYNLGELRERGRFNPVMKPEEVTWANKYALLEGDELKEVLLG